MAINEFEEIATGVLTPGATAPTAAVNSREAARQNRLEELRAARETRMADQARARATANPMRDPTTRPAAPPADDQNVYYYGWIGGASSGQWKLYKTPVDSPQAASAEARAEGGKTQATFNSAVGANALSGAPSGAPSGGASAGAGTGGAGGTVAGAGGATGGAGTSTRAGTGAGTTGVAQTGLTADQQKSQSAFELFRGYLRQYGIEALAADIERYKLDGLSDAELFLRLRTESKAYQRRFAANEQRVAKGLRALTEAQYIALEDGYQDIMRQYGMPESYYRRGEMGRQEGFEKFIANDVSATEVEDRIQAAQNRVLNAAPQVAQSLRSFYPDITNGDLLAYALDPDKTLTDLRRRITAAEIGAGAALAGLGTTRARAEELGAFGVTGEQAREGFRAVAEVAPRGSQLAEIYKQSPYTQATAEAEVFGLGGAVEAARQRRKLTELEQASFAGQSGVTQGALARERAGQF